MEDGDRAEEIHVIVKITGHVQGVGFRQSARQRARELGIRATAVNRDDGSVIIEARGPHVAVDKLVEWTRRGPPRAVVEELTVVEQPLESRDVR